MRYQYNMKCVDCDKLQWLGYDRTNAAGRAQAHADYNLHTVTFITVDMQKLSSSEERISPDLQFLF